MINACPICNSTKSFQVLPTRLVSACAGTPLTFERLAAEKTGTLDIVCCENCSFIYNRQADPNIISQIYSDDFSACVPNSPKMMARLKYISDEVLGRGLIEGRRCLEIGSGNFEFSELLVGNGAVEVTAFEPSTNFSCKHSSVKHVADYFSSEKAGDKKFDLVVLRHVLEHIIQPKEFLIDLTKVLRPGSMVYIEVPNAKDIVAKKRIYDFFYEHVNYFHSDILNTLLEELGFHTLKEVELIEGQHFAILAQYNAEKGKSNRYLPTVVGTRAQGLKEFVATFQAQLEGVLSKFDKVAIYGGGAHAITTLGLLAAQKHKIGMVFDIDHFKSGKFTPLTHTPIQLPNQRLLNEFPAVIIIASLHQDEIFRNLVTEYQYRGHIFATHPQVMQLKDRETELSL